MVLGTDSSKLADSSSVQITEKEGSSNGKPRMESKRSWVSEDTPLRKRRKAQLNTDIIWDILLRLPMEAVLACRCACKTWYNVTKNPTFIDMHTNISSKLPPRFFIYRPLHLHKFLTLEKDELFLCNSEEGGKARKMPLDENLIRNSRIVFSHNGLLCIAPHDFRTRPSLVICNPITNEWIELLQPDNVKNPHFSQAGFCFVPARREHIIVQMFSTYGKHDNRVNTGYLLTSERPSWRLLTLPPCVNSNCVLEDTVYWNNAFHWKFTMFDEIFDNLGILSFDTIQETFQVILFPRDWLGVSDRSNKWKATKLLVLNGRLVLTQLHETETKLWEVMVGRVGEYSLVFRGTSKFDAREFFFVSGINGIVNLLISLQTGFVVGLINDLKEFWGLRIQDDPCSFTPFSYNPSLVSVHSMGFPELCRTEERTH